MSDKDWSAFRSNRYLNNASFQNSGGQSGRGGTSYWTNGLATLMQADARELPLPDRSVHCVVTSPPYWGLRDYGLGAWEGGDADCQHVKPEPKPYEGWTDGRDPVKGDIWRLRNGDPNVACIKCGARQQAAGIGLEPTLGEWLANIVAVGRELKRVLRDDGCFFLNLGDSYSSGRIVSDSVKIREDLTEDEYVEAALAVSRELLTVRQADGKGASKGAMRFLLRETEEIQLPGESGNTPKTQRPVESVSRKASQRTESENSGTQQKHSTFSNQGAWQPLCLLRGDKTYIPLPRPYQGRRQTRVSEIQPPANLSASTERRAADRQVSDSVLELQRGAGATRLLPSLRIDKSDIPAGAERFFEPEYTIGPKSLIGQPWRAALALQADGWILRSAVVWHKPNPMPESVTDRPTSAYEMVFLFSKQGRYFYDAEAVRQESTPESAIRQQSTMTTPTARRDTSATDSGIDAFHIRNYGKGNPPTGANLRNVWTIPTQGRPEAHFATFPDELPRRCILAGTSEHGVCGNCGASWVRVVSKERTTLTETSPKWGNEGIPYRREGGQFSGKAETTTQTLGWEPACACDAARVPATILDPFIGSGTTLAVALALGRQGVGTDLNPEYLEIARKRIGKADAQPMRMV